MEIEPAEHLQVPLQKGVVKSILSRLYRALKAQQIEVPADIVNQCLQKAAPLSPLCQPVQDRLNELSKEEWLTTKFSGKIIKKYTKQNNRDQLVLVSLDDVPRQRFYFPLHEVTDWLASKLGVANDFSVEETYALQKEYGVNLSEVRSDKDYVGLAPQPQVSDLLVGAMVANTGETQDEVTTGSRPPGDTATPTPGISPVIVGVTAQQGNESGGRTRLKARQPEVPAAGLFLFGGAGSGEHVTTTQNKHPLSHKYRSLNGESKVVRKGAKGVKKKRGMARRWTAPRPVRRTTPRRDGRGQLDVGGEGLARSQELDVDMGAIKEDDPQYHRVIPVQVLEEDVFEPKGKEHAGKGVDAAPRKPDGQATPWASTQNTPLERGTAGNAQATYGDLGDSSGSVHTTTPLDIVITCMQACRDMQRVLGGVSKARGQPLRQSRRRRRIMQNLQQLSDDFMEEEAELLEGEPAPSVAQRQLTDSLKLALNQAQMLLDSQQDGRAPSAPESSGAGAPMAQPPPVPNLQLLPGPAVPAPWSGLLLPPDLGAPQQYPDAPRLVPGVVSNMPPWNPGQVPHLPQGGQQTLGYGRPPPNQLPENMQRHLQTFTEELATHGRATGVMGPPRSQASVPRPRFAALNPQVGRRGGLGPSQLRPAVEPCLTPAADQPVPTPHRFPPLGVTPGDGSGVGVGPPRLPVRSGGVDGVAGSAAPKPRAPTELTVQKVIPGERGVSIVAQGSVHRAEIPRARDAGSNGGPRVMKVHLVTTKGPVISQPGATANGQARKGVAGPKDKPANGRSPYADDMVPPPEEPTEQDLRVDEPQVLPIVVQEVAPKKAAVQQYPRAAGVGNLPGDLGRDAGWKVPAKPADDDCDFLDDVDDDEDMQQHVNAPGAAPQGAQAAQSTAAKNQVA